MSTATLLRASTALRTGSRLTRASRGSTVRAFAKASSSSSDRHHAPAPAKQQQDDDVRVHKHATPAPAPALRAWPSLTRRPSSLLGSALFGDLDREFDEMMNAMTSIWGPLTAPAAGATTPLASSAVPRALPSGIGAVDVHEDASGYQIKMDTPGVPKDALDITISDGVLTVAGHRSEEKKGGGGENGKAGPVVRERVWGSFSRSFRVPADADVDGIKASMDHGVLKLIVPRKPEAEPQAKKVAIE